MAAGEINKALSVRGSFSMSAKLKTAPQISFSVLEQQGQARIASYSPIITHLIKSENL